MAQRLFCFGLGFSALALARRLLPQGWQVAGTVTSAEKQAALAAQGIEAHLWTRGAPLPAGVVESASHILSSIGPDKDGDPVMDSLGGRLGALSGAAWIGYLSATSVYGDYRGAWVDETAPLRPSHPRAWRRLYAEQAWEELRRLHGLPLHIFRLAGIYGPGRSYIEGALAGTLRPVVKRGQMFGRIHVEDIAQILEASMAAPHPGRIYNGSDDEPAAQHLVVEHAYQLLGQEPLPRIPYEEATATMSEMARSFWIDNRRVRNERIKQELGVTLRYPTYREGLRACLEARQQPDQAGQQGPT